MVLKRASGLGISTVVVDGYYDSTVLYISLLTTIVAISIILIVPREESDWSNALF